MGSDHNLEVACERWLRAREQFHRDSQTEALNEFADAESALLVAFASAWTADEAMLMTMYQQFREVLRGAEEGACQLNRTSC